MTTENKEKPKMRLISTFGQFLLDRQQELGREITIKEIAEGAGVSRDAVSALKRGISLRFDGATLGQVAAFFGYEEGEIPPFLVLSRED